MRERLEPTETNLFLELLIRDQVLGRIVLRLELLRHVLVEANVARVIATLIHLLVAGSALGQGLAVVAAAGDAVVLVARVLALILRMHLPLDAVVDVIVWSLLDDSAAVRVAVRCGPLNEVLRHRCLLVLELSRGVVCDLHWFIL